jgi:hypothetical protein
MPPEWEASFRSQLQRIIDRQPQYVRGGSESEEKGLDCSGFIFLAAKRAGIPVSRTTALNMSRGLAGWRGVDIELRDAGELDIVWWTWLDKPQRPFGHVGVLWRGKDNFPAVAHASQTIGRVTVGQMKGKFLRDLAKVRRLTIGDR